MWNAATGRSNGWEQWSIDLAAYAGKQVEVSITYVSDPAIQGLGVFLDKVVVTAGTTSEFDLVRERIGELVCHRPTCG